MEPGDTVRIIRDESGMAAGSLGLFFGWYLRESGTGVVSFYNVGPTRVPIEALQLVEHRESDPSCSSWHTHLANVA
jgi:hypothetical protein